jgi:hypothetical protein
MRRFNNTPLKLQINEGESNSDYNLRWRAYREELASMERAKVKSQLWKEDIVAAVWHPRRFEKWLEAGVEDWDE